MITTQLLSNMVHVPFVHVSCKSVIHSQKCISEKSWFFKRGFIVSNTSMFAMHEVHATSGDPSVHYISQFPSDNIGAFTVDATSDMLYFVDTGSNFLKKYDIISQQSSNITSLTSATGKTLKILVTTMKLAFRSLIVFIF